MKPINAIETGVLKYWEDKNLVAVMRSFAQDAGTDISWELHDGADVLTLARNMLLALHGLCPPEISVKLLVCIELLDILRYEGQDDDLTETTDLPF